MNNSLLFLVGNLVLAASSIPMILGRVPPNRYYGFRTKRTLAERDTWYRANRFSGWTILCATAASSVLILMIPGDRGIDSTLRVVALCVPLTLAVVASFAYLSTLPPSPGESK